MGSRKINDDKTVSRAKFWYQRIKWNLISHSVPKIFVIENTAGNIFPIGHINLQAHNISSSASHIIAEQESVLY